MKSTTHNKFIIQRINAINENAIRLLEDTATLMNELSGGSDSSILNQTLSRSHREKLISKRRECQLKSRPQVKETRSAS